MAHLSVIRRGWQNEHLAAFLLSRFAFVASPLKIGDDLGADFFCTYFETITENKREYLSPKNTFAIQVKSSKRIIDITKHIKYFLGIELPFFVGIVNQMKSNITIYSAEYLPIFLHKENLNTLKALKLKLCPFHNFSPENYYIEENKKKKFQLLCPKVATLSTEMEDNDINEETVLLKKTIKRIHKNISSIASHEYILEVGPDGNLQLILAGSGSYRVFRDNFKKRLSEVFHNLECIYNIQISKFDINEFKFYEKIYDEMLDREEELPSYLTDVVERFKANLNKG